MGKVFCVISLLGRVWYRKSKGQVRYLPSTIPLISVKPLRPPAVAAFVLVKVAAQLLKAPYHGAQHQQQKSKIMSQVAQNQWLWLQHRRLSKKRILGLPILQFWKFQAEPRTHLIHFSQQEAQKYICLKLSLRTSHHFIYPGLGTTWCPSLDYSASALWFRSPEKETGLLGQLLFSSVHNSACRVGIMPVSYAEIQPEGQKKNTKVWTTTFQVSMIFETSCPIYL